VYRTFEEVTRGALQHAVAEAELTLAADESEKVIAAYNELHVFPEVPDALGAVGENTMLEAYVFSNGTGEMVSASVSGSPDLQAHAGVFKGLLTVEEVQAFKPNNMTYDYMLLEVGKADAPEDVWLVSANPFDIVGAAAAGLQTAWVDRAGTGWVDRLGAVIGGLRPTLVVSGVDKAVEEIVEAAGLD